MVNENKLRSEPLHILARAAPSDRTQSHLTRNHAHISTTHRVDTTQASWKIFDFSSAINLENRHIYLGTFFRALQLCLQSLDIADLYYFFERAFSK